MSQDAVAIERLLQADMAVTQAAQKPLFVVDYQKAMRILADRYSAPAEAVFSERETKEQTDAFNEQQAQAAAPQQAEAEANAAQAAVDADAANVELMQNVRGM